MEYPIIDTLTNAYIRNGWTGLEVKTGKNLFDIVSFFNDRSVVYQETSEVYRFNTNSNLYVNTLILSENNELFSLSANTITNVTTNNFRIELLNTNNSVVATINIDTLTATGNGCKIRFNWSQAGTAEVKDVQIEKGSQITPYEPFTQTTDIFSRTRLPLIRYFPHPVIDALQRAAAGTQTADDTEILRHYLTPLGIGGI